MYGVWQQVVFDVNYQIHTWWHMSTRVTWPNLTQFPPKCPHHDYNDNTTSSTPTPCHQPPSLVECYISEYKGTRGRKWGNMRQWDSHCCPYYAHTLLQAHLHRWPLAQGSMIPPAALTMPTSYCELICIGIPQHRAVWSLLLPLLWPYLTSSPSMGQCDSYHCLCCIHHFVLVVNTAEESIIPSLLSLHVLSCLLLWSLVFQ